MANWTGVITNAGNDVLSEWVNEKTLNFNSAAAGQGTVATAGMLAQTALVNQKQIASIIGADRVSTGIRLKIRITAPQTAYTLNQYGVWASVTGGSSTMIALFQHEDGIPIPSATESPDFVYTFYALISTSNTGEWTVNIDTSALVTLDDVATAIATAVATKEGLIKNAAVKNSIADADAVAVVDSADDSKTKRVLWSTIKAALNQLFVPLTRKINSKALSADVTLTGDDIKTSASDSTTLSSSLSNTALSSHGILQDVNILDWAITRKRSGAFTSQPGCTGVPNSSLWYAGNLFVNIAESAWSIILIEPSSMVAWYNATESGVWKGWKPIATATPPQEFDLPLANGYTPQYTHSCIYYKTQETIVGVNVALIGEIPANSDIIIGTLPAGFRPKATCRGVAGSHFSPYGVGSVSIDENGNINVRFTAAQVRCNFTICFLAAD